MALWRGSRLVTKVLVGCCAPLNSAWQTAFPACSRCALLRSNCVLGCLATSTLAAQAQAAVTRPTHWQRQQEENRIAAASLLQSIQVYTLREALERESEHRVQMPYSELIEKCRETRAALSREDAVRLCEALSTAGVVLRYKDIVYLRPEDVADMILQALPETQGNLKGGLDTLREQITTMENEKKIIDSDAEKRIRMFTWAGLFVLVAQFFLFLRLTYWELSWDVMEPVAYFFSTFCGILAYIYFLATHEEFGYQALREKLGQHYVNKDMKKKNFNIDRCGLHIVCSCAHLIWLLWSF